MMLVTRPSVAMGISSVAAGLFQYAPCSVDVISVVISMQSRRKADAMQNKMLMNHMDIIKIHDFSPDTREWYRNGSVTAHHVSPTTKTTDKPPEMTRN